MARYDLKYRHKLRVKLKVRVTVMTLLYIEHLWEKMAEQFSLPSLPVLLDTIKEGCVEVTWLVPIPSAEQIKAKINDSTDFLRSFDIFRVMLEEELLYAEQLDLVKVCELSL